MQDPIPRKAKAEAVLQKPRLVPTTEDSFVSTLEQRKNKKWTDAVPDGVDTLDLEAELAQKHAEFVSEKVRA